MTSSAAPVNDDQVLDDLDQVIACCRHPVDNDSQRRTLETIRRKYSTESGEKPGAMLAGARRHWFSSLRRWWLKRVNRNARDAGATKQLSAPPPDTGKSDDALLIETLNLLWRAGPSPASGGQDHDHGQEAFRRMFLRRLLRFDTSPQNGGRPRPKFVPGSQRTIASNGKWCFLSGPLSEEVKPNSASFAKAVVDDPHLTGVHCLAGIRGSGKSHLLHQITEVCYEYGDSDDYSPPLTIRWNLGTTFTAREFLVDAIEDICKQIEYQCEHPPYTPKTAPWWTMERLFMQTIRFADLCAANIRWATQLLLILTVLGILSWSLEFSWFGLEANVYMAIAMMLLAVIGIGLGFRVHRNFLVPLEWPAMRLKPWWTAFVPILGLALGAAACLSLPEAVPEPNSAPDARATTSAGHDSPPAANPQVGADGGDDSGAGKTRPVGLRTPLAQDSSAQEIVYVHFSRIQFAGYGAIIAWLIVLVVQRSIGARPVRSNSPTHKPFRLIKLLPSLGVGAIVFLSLLYCYPYVRQGNSWRFGTSGAPPVAAPARSNQHSAEQTQASLIGFSVIHGLLMFEGLVGIPALTTQQSDARDFGSSRWHFTPCGLPLGGFMFGVLCALVAPKWWTLYWNGKRLRKHLRGKDEPISPGIPFPGAVGDLARALLPTMENLYEVQGLQFPFLQDHLRIFLDDCQRVFGRVVILIDDVDMLPADRFHDFFRVLRPVTRVRNTCVVVAVPRFLYDVMQNEVLNDLHSTTRGVYLIGDPEVYRSDGVANDHSVFVNNPILGLKRLLLHLMNLTVSIPDQSEVFAGKKRSLASCFQLDCLEFLVGRINDAANREGQLLFTWWQDLIDQGISYREIMRLVETLLANRGEVFGLKQELTPLQLYREYAASELSLEPRLESHAKHLTSCEGLLVSSDANTTLPAQPIPEVYFVVNGSRYHLDDRCPAIVNRQARKVTFDVAVMMGLSACRLCHAPHATLGTMPENETRKTIDELNCVIREHRSDIIRLEGVLGIAVGPYLTDLPSISMSGVIKARPSSNVPARSAPCIHLYTYGVNQQTLSEIDKRLGIEGLQILATGPNEALRQVTV